MQFLVVIQLYWKWEQLIVKKGYYQQLAYFLFNCRTSTKRHIRRKRCTIGELKSCSVVYSAIISLVICLSYREWKSIKDVVAVPGFSKAMCRWKFSFSLFHLTWLLYFTFVFIYIVSWCLAVLILLPLSMLNFGRRRSLFTRHHKPPGVIPCTFFLFSKMT